jgi:tetratricopeptide (TPR) repeat protein
MEGMKTRILFRIVAVIFTSSCKEARPSTSESTKSKTATHPTTAQLVQESKRAQAEKTRKLDRENKRTLDEQFASANRSFRAKDIPAALEEIGKVLAIDPHHAPALNLRGSCHVELRDFEVALEDFTNASEKAPHNASIQFNKAEVLFVTKRWDEASTAFLQAKERLGPESLTIRELIDFKLMLCEAGRGNREEFLRLAEINQKEPDSPIAVYTLVAQRFFSSDYEAAQEALIAATHSIPDANTRAPWNDSLAEFGYVNSFEVNE